MTVRFAAGLFSCFFALAATASAQTPPAPAPSGAPSGPGAGAAAGVTAAAAAAAAAPRPPAPGDIPAYDTFVKDTVVQNGLFQLVRKDGKVYMRLGADQLDKDYLQTSVPKNGLGGYFVLAGDVFQQEARVVRFVRVGKQVMMLWPHTRFIADPNTPLADAVRSSTADSVMGVGAIVAEKKDDKSIVVDLSVLMGDVMDFANNLNEIVKDPTNPLGSYRLDSQRSYFGVSKAFPKNVLIEANQTYVSLKPSVINTVVDPRSIQMKIGYNFAELPDASKYMPRLADERVGYFDDAHISFDHIERMDNIQHYVMRWNMKASDPSKPISPAVHPIVYTLQNTIPMEYRDPIRRAILAWNAPFEKIGISGAVQVQEQPKDPDFDPDDIRYNMIRWLTEANSGGFAEAQLTWDPRTGEVFRSGVMIDSDLVRFGVIGRHVLGVTADGSEDPQHDEQVAPAHNHFAHNDGPGTHAQVMFAAVTEALMNGGNPSEIAQNTASEYLHAVVLHEVGHDFGLAHNFIGHMAYSAAQIRDKKFTEKNGIASSVMEYNPANVWPKGMSSGTVEQTVLGPYDYHVIKWGYAPIPGAKTPLDEVPTLSRWANNWTDPKLRYAGDEDVAWFGHAVDPRVHQWSLTNDPLGWCDTQLSLINSLLPKLDQKFPQTEHPYDEERVAFGSLVNKYALCSTNAAHWIGGEYLSRSRRGDPHAQEPITPVSRAEERRAFTMLDKYVFSNAAFQYDPRTLRRLVYAEHSTFSNLGQSYAPRHDISVADFAGRVQLRALGYMYSPMVLARIADLPTKAKPGETMTLADLFGWTQTSIYGDIANGKIANATQVRRNLQRRYAAMLRALALEPRGVPYDAQALARYELVALDRDLVAAMARSGYDVQTRAHLSSLHEDVSRTLHAQRVIGS